MAERFSGTRVTLADTFGGDIAADREVHSVLTSVRVISPPESKSHHYQSGGGGERYIVDMMHDTKSPSSIHQDRSDDDESDHGTPDPSAQPLNRCASPSPYTANTERARQFNAYVRALIEQKMDILIPISHQPRDTVQSIIADTSMKFPEFSLCVRKRIRTFLKSYRRSKRVKDLQAAVGAGSHLVPGVASHLPSSPREPTLSTGPTVLVDPSSDDQAIPHLPSTDVSHTVAVPQPSSLRTTVVTISSDTHSSNNMDEEEDEEEEKPSMKKPRLSSPQPPVPASLHTAAAGMINNASLSNPEVSAVRQLIIGYRESAAFLSQAADQLEQLLTKESLSNNV